MGKLISQYLKGYSIPIVLQEPVLDLLAPVLYRILLASYLHSPEYKAKNKAYKEEKMRQTVARKQTYIGPQKASEGELAKRRAEHQMNKAAANFGRALGANHDMTVNEVNQNTLNTANLMGYMVAPYLMTTLQSGYYAITNRPKEAALTAGLGYGIPIVFKGISQLPNNVKNLSLIKNGNSPSFGNNTLFRRIDDSAYKDIQQTGVIRPNPNGVFSREGHILSGTWWSSDGAASGGKIRYPGNKVIEISENHPLFPTRTTPGTQYLGYKVGDMQIDAYSPFIRIHLNGPFGKLISKENYTPQISFGSYWSTNFFNKLSHPFNAEAVRLLTNRGIQNYGKYLSKLNLFDLILHTKNLKLENGSDYRFFGDRLSVQKGTLDEWSLLHELGHHFDANNRFSQIFFKKMPSNYRYSNELSDDFREFFADYFATNLSKIKPFDYSLDPNLKSRVDILNNLVK